ncbi:phospholipase D-like domain-containing protein [Cryobacterium serini]|uniref:Phospholipase D-like domain-containing protein n=1 Tax=Cryobacterium serini TaxID=1259201 RepID=A0A4R9BSA8_9MICO|nr:phospholipase D-like domain-containing protein [Cryobacterium serini]TFD89788.1 hypothetical protein E3T51_03455 [Cryobacterium serini]
MDDASATLYRQFANKRPGLRLVSVEPAALPITILNTTVLAQEKKPLPLLDEFVIRAISGGLRAVSDIGGLLGLEESLIAASIVDLATAGNLRYNPTLRTATLTAIGEQVAQDLSAVTPVELSIKPAFDRMLWRVADYARDDIINKSLAVDEGRIMLPARHLKHIAGDEVTARSLNLLLQGDLENARQLEILRVIRTKASVHRYLRCWLLVFANESRGSAAELAVVVNDASSSLHDIALEEAGGAERLGISVHAGDSRTELDPALEVARIQTIEPASIPDLLSVLTAAPIEESLLVRSLDMYEHRIVLREAFETATQRILIVSPWVKGAVVTTEFLAAAENALRRGVQLDIVHGYGDDDRGSDAHALRKLSNLQSRFKKNFNLIRHPNTHAKVLIFDDVWISTSFNWLSFKGAADRTYRMEEGTLVKSNEHADREYAQYRERLADINPPAPVRL